MVVPSAARRLCGRGIDAAGHAGNDGDAGAGQVAREPFGGRHSVRRGMAGADHADADRGQQFGAPAGEQDRGRIEDAAQQFGIARVAEGISCAPASRTFCCWRRHLRNCSRWRRTGRRRRSGRRLRVRWRRRGRWPGECAAFEQEPDAAGAEAGNHAQRQPVEFFFVEAWESFRCYCAPMGAGFCAGWE
jgi:hypothetical protein